MLAGEGAASALMKRHRARPAHEALKGCGSDKCNIVFRTTSGQCGAIATAENRSVGGGAKRRTGCGLLSRSFLGWLAPQAVAVVPGGADAREETSSRTIMILSEGQSTCGVYNAYPELQPVRASWVLGYISGVNSRSAATEALAGKSFQMPESVIDWLRSYCAFHPTDVLAVAAEALRRDFLARERQ
jgi:hypothetical protein